MRVVLLGLALLLLAGCAGGLPDMPKGAIAGCVDVEYTGTITKSQTDGRLLFLSENQAARIQSVQDAVDLANAFGCDRD